MKHLKPDNKFFKESIYFIFLIISCLLMVNLFVQLSDKLYLQIIFGVLSIAFELFRQYIVILAKFYWKSNFMKSCSLWFVYIINVSVVLIASVGFSLSTIDAKVKNTEVYNLERQSIINNIKSNEEEIERLAPVKNALNINSQRYFQISQRIDSLQKVNRGLLQSLKEYKEVKVNVNQDIYGALGNVIKINGEWIKLYMLMVLSLLLELGLLLTSWEINVETKTGSGSIQQEQKQEPIKDNGLIPSHINELLAVTQIEPIKQEEKHPFSEYIRKNREKILLYIDNLVENGLNRLNSNRTINKKTEISISECMCIRDLLQKLAINGQSIIDTRQGTSKLNFPKSEVKELIASF